MPLLLGFHALCCPLASSSAFWVAFLMALSFLFSSKRFRISFSSCLTPEEPWEASETAAPDHASTQVNVIHILGKSGLRLPEHQVQKQGLGTEERGAASETSLCSQDNNTDSRIQSADAASPRQQGFCKPLHAESVMHVHTRICEGWVIVKDRDHQQEVCDGREGDARCCSKAPDEQPKLFSAHLLATVCSNARLQDGLCCCCCFVLQLFHATEPIAAPTVGFTMHSAGMLM